MPHCNFARVPADVTAAVPAFSYRFTSAYVTSATTEAMAASADRSPPPFSASEEPETGEPDLSDGDSDEGEDIFLGNVSYNFVWY